MNSIATPARSVGPLPLALPARACSGLLIALGLIGLIGLFGLAAAPRAPLVYDEVPYLKPVGMLNQYGLSLRFLREYPEPAGLLHNVLHWALAPWTGLKPPLVRLVNPVLLALTILVTFLTLRLIGSEQPLSSSLAMMGIPFTWVLSGMVLTEMPSVFLSSLSICLLLLGRQVQSGRPAASILAAFAGGLLLGLAFLSRANVLVILGALPCLALADWRRSLRTVAAFVSGALLVAGPVMGYWGGLVPPHSVVPVGTASFSVYNMILSFSYAATVMLILAPHWFDLRSWWTLGIMGVIIALNGASGIVEIPVARSVVARLPAVFGEVVPRLAGSVMLGLAALLVVCSVKNLYARRHDPVWLFLCLAMLLLVASPGKIVHQYSSRYTGMASGMMVMASDPYAPPTLGRVLRPALGMLIGISSLLSYYALGG
jgi:4-amino-4-deoxy-L-arabinose transferase-like glycosyltransferase